LIDLSFYGAARTVTGSKYLLKINNKKILIDCGIFQGQKELRQKNWIPPSFDTKEIEAVIITHTHIDHIGYLPKLIKYGFNGKIYSTAPTAEIAKILLIDTAHLFEEDAAFRNKKKLTSHKKALPLYTVEDAQDVFHHFEPVNFNQWVELDENIQFRYHVVGHILGAASVEFKLNDNEKKISVLFSGDIGRYAVPLIIDPSPPPETDYLICESTYGGEIHEPQDIFFEFATMLDDIIKNRKILLIPAFAVGRTQQITYIINVLMEQKRIPPIDIHIDSPMAVRVTDVYRHYPSYHSINCDLLKREKNVFYGKHVYLHRKRKSSQLLNKLKGPAVIISASGMLTGGRILHHLLNRLSRPETTLALVGYMARGTLGRKILEGDKLVYIHKQPVEVKAQIKKLLGLSGHADSYEIMHWLNNLRKGPKRVFVTHGEEEKAIAMADEINKLKGWSTYVPTLYETVEL